jgi:hypothetical protein
MRFRSTGLGKTELEAQPIGLEPVDDLLILHIQTTNPVRWRIRAGIQHKDVFKLIRLAITPKVIKYFIKYLLGSVKLGSPKEPEDF